MVSSKVHIELISLFLSSSFISASCSFFSRFVLYIFYFRTKGPIDNLDTEHHRFSSTEVKMH